MTVNVTNKNLKYGVFVNIKKKIIVATASILLFNSSAYAEQFYFKTSVSGNSFNQVKFEDGFKAKAKIAPSLAIGFGYYILDNLRADLTFEHYIAPIFKCSITNHEEHGSQKQKLRPTLSTLMVNTNVDVIDFDSSKIFVGLGAGVARHKTKYTTAGISLDGDNFDLAVSTKTSNNFSYALSAGISLLIVDGLNAELAYSWRDFGSTKPRKNEDNEDITKKHLYRAHNLSLGFRIDI